MDNYQCYFELLAKDTNLTTHMIHEQQQKDPCIEDSYWIYM